MDITIMGSAAAEAVPSLWCNCECCKTAIKNGGKDIRCRTAYLIDDDTCVDCGPDIFTQSVRYGMKWEKLDRLLITHPHSDHCDAIEMSWRRKGFANFVRPLEMVGSPKVKDMIKNVLIGNEEMNGNLFEETLHIHFVEAQPGAPIQSGDMEILPLRANHGAWKEAACLNYIIRRGNHALLIANDTGFWSEETWQIAAGANVELAIIDCTCALAYPDSVDGHMGANIAVKFRDRLLQDKVLAPNGRAIVNHFSHNGNSIHELLEAFFVPKGIQVGYDGMRIQL